jgi:PAS domain S-box-containing protein
MRDEDQSEPDALIDALPVAVVTVARAEGGLRVASANAEARRLLGPLVPGAHLADCPAFAAPETLGRLHAAAARGARESATVAAPDGTRATARVAPWRDGLAITIHPFEGPGEADALRERLEVATSVGGVGVWEHYPKEDRIVWNDVMFRLTGTDPAAFQGRISDWEDRIAPDFRETAQAMYAEQERSGACDVDIRIVTPAGEPRWLISRGRVVARAPDGSPTRIVGVNADVSEARLAAERASAAERRLVDAVEALPHALTLFDPEGRLVLWNSVCERFFERMAPALKHGASAASILRYGVEHGQYPEATGREEAFIAERMGRFLSAEGDFELEADGDRWVRVVERRTGAGDFVTVRVDVTDLKRQQAALQAARDGLAEAKAELERFFDLSPDLMGVGSIDGTVLKLNRAWTDLLGHPVDSLVGESHLKLVHPEDRDATAKARVTLAGNSRVLDFVSRMRRADGTYIPVEWRSAPAADGRVYFVGRDVAAREAQRLETERARAAAEAALAGLDAATRELRNFFDLSADLLGISDASGRFVKLNRAWEDLLGLPLAELQGARFLDFVHPDDLAPTLKAAAEVEAGAGLDGFVNRYRNADGGYVSLEWRTTRPHGGVIYFVARDVTAREAALRERERRAAEERALSAALALALSDLDETAFLGRALEAMAAETAWLGEQPRGAVLLVEPETETLSVAASHGVDGGFCVRCGAAREGLCLCRAVAAGGETLFEARFEEDGAGGGRYAAPIRDGATLYGVLALTTRTPVGDSADVAFLGRIGHALALGLSRRRAATAAEAERRRALDALAGLEGFHKALDRHAIVSVTDRSGVILDVNDRFCEAMGYAREELIGLTHQIVNSGVHDSAMWGDFWNTILRGEPWHGEVCNAARDGRRRWFDTTIIPVPDATGAAERFVALRFDVTERRAMAARLVETKTRLEQVAALSGVGAWDYDPQTGAMRWDAVTRAIFGVGPDHRPDRESTRAFYAAEVRETVRLAFDACLERGEPYDLELPILAADGRHAWVRAVAALTADSDGRTRVVGGVQDVTERRARELQTERLRARLEAVIENTDAVIFIKDRDDRLLLTNRRFAEMAGVDMAEGLPDSSLWPEEVAEALAATNRRVFETGERFLGEERIVTGTGETRTYLSSKSLIYDAELDDHVLCCVSTDVTALKRLQQSLEENRRAAEQANVAKSQFLATMSHEIRTPMNGVIGMADLLDRTIEDPAQKRMIRVIKDSGEVLLNVINDILDFSKIEVGKMTVEAAPFLIGEVMRKVDSIHMLKAAEKGVAFRVTVAPDAAAPRVGDPYRLQQVLHNLVSNAVKFTDRGAVSVEVRASGDEAVRFVVSDTGIGMTEEQAGRVFDEFAQADSSTTRRFGGTGLGMAIVRGLVAAMDGTLTLDTAPGRGTTVTIDLRLPRASGPIASDEAVDEAPPGLRVLAADDNDVNRLVIAGFLRALGVEADVVDGGRAAVEAHAAGDYDILLLDISMPDVDGIEALRLIRAHEAETDGRRIPAVAVTANALSHQVEEFFAAGFDGHLPKPIRREALVAALRRHAPGAGAQTSREASMRP